MYSALHAPPFRKGNRRRSLFIPYTFRSSRRIASGIKAQGRYDVIRGLNILSSKRARAALCYVVEQREGDNERLRNEKLEIGLSGADYIETSSRALLPEKCYYRDIRRTMILRRRVSTFACILNITTDVHYIARVHYSWRHKLLLLANDS